MCGGRGEGGMSAGGWKNEQKAEPAVSIRKPAFCSASLTSTAAPAAITTAANVQAFRTVL